MDGKSMPAPYLTSLVRAAKDLVDRSTRQRDDVKRAARTRLDVGAHPKAGTEPHRLTFGRIELGQIVGDPILEARIIDADLAAIAGQVEAKEIAVVEREPGRTDEEVARVLWAER